MITYVVEEMTDINIEEVMPLFEAHKEELESFKDMKLNPDWDAYKMLQDLKRLVWLVAREDGVIVGYAVYILSYNIHHKDFLFAMEDILYVVKNKKSSRVGINLIKKSEEILKAMGVDVITHYARFTNNYAPFLERLGYKKVEIMLAKRINI